MAVLKDPNQMYFSIPFKETQNISLFSDVKGRMAIKNTDHISTQVFKKYLLSTYYSPDMLEVRIKKNNKIGLFSQHCVVSESQVDFLQAVNLE